MPDAQVDRDATLWRDAEPRSGYDAIIIGGGGHGLATAFYLASRHGMTDIAIVEKSWLGGGNMARNTTVIRSNYLWPESTALYDYALTLWESLEQELDFPVLFDQRGVLGLAHSIHDVQEAKRRVYANRAVGVDAEWLERDQIADVCPIVNLSEDIRYPVHGASFQPRGGIARHDQVAWGYARGAHRLGVDLIENCEVTDILTRDGEVRGVVTSRGTIESNRVLLAAAGHSSVLAGMVGIQLPLASHPLQALVSELLEPVLPTVVMSGAVHLYVSQAHKGELVMGAGMDLYNGYGQRGSFHVIERQMAAAVELFPIFETAHVLRSWGGIVDVSPDASPIVGSSGIEGLVLNCGWGTGGFKATPGIGACLAETLATGTTHPLLEAFDLGRFTTGALIAEHGAAGVAGVAH